ncbi:MAG: glycosyltransferase family 4 protein [Bacteroidetes bacterium]|nr:glycosyltransferase family 4 protein [Bacteroidota bacterium]
MAETRPIRVVFDAHVLTPHRSGIGEFNWHLLRAMVDHCSDRVRLYLYVPSGIVAVESEGDIVRLTQKVQDGDFYRLRHQWRLPRLLRKGEYDLFHSPDFMYPFLCPLPVVSTIYDLIPLVHPEYLVKALKVRILPLYRFLVRTAARRSARVITISECSRADILRLLGARPETVDLVFAANTLQPNGDPATAVPDHRLIPGKYLLYVGRHDPYKGLGLLMQAFARAVQDGLSDEIQLAVAGKRDARYPFEETARELGLQDRVVLLDYISRDDLSVLYTHALGLVFPSLYEGFGLPLLDAMAHGTPVVSSDRASLPEVGGDAVLYIDPEQTDHFARTLKSFVENSTLRETLIEKGRQRVQQFSWNRVAEATVNSYMRAIDQTHS